jgi:class 3 adenylate cyclase
VQDRPRVWLFGVLLALPVAGLVLLLAVPGIDVMWEHHPSHFLLVLSVALINVALALITSSGFLALHALATPNVLLDHPNSGFAIATPIGLLLASGFAAGSAVELSRADAARILRRRTLIRGALALLLIAWAVGSLTGVPFLDRPLEEEAPIAFRLLAPVGIGLYAFAAWRYLRIFRVRRRALPLSVAVAFVLLAEALIAVAFARSWHVSWWEWHVLMAVAFAIVTISVRGEYRREGSITAAFGGLYLEQTLERIDRRSSGAIAQLMPAVRSRESLAPVLERLRREGFGSDEIVLLERAAREMARVDELFRPYVGPALADRLELEPSIAELGGREAEVTVLFADLAGFTSFSGGRSPTDVVQMLNAYWASAVPIVTEREGGLIERFAGDAILVVFNALEDQPDHPLRAVRAATAMQRAVTETSHDHPDWPRFRIGINSGPAALGNVGVGAHRSFTAIGDTTNVAARLQSAAPPGGILIGQSTYDAVADEVVAEPFGDLDLKGKPGPVTTYEVRVDRTTPA